jgi:hypothetical protein
MPDILINNKRIYNFEYNFLIFISLLTKVVIFLFIIGFFQDKPKAYVEFNSIIKIVLGLFLIYRFNKYRKEKITFTELDREVCYSVGIYIIVISFIDVLNEYIEEFRQIIKPYTMPIVDYVKYIINVIIYNYNFKNTFS